MFALPRDRETVCAVSTPHGRGGISVIRISGNRSLVIARQLCSFLPESPITHKVYFGTIKTKDAQEVIDEVLVTFFAEGKSFTGEEVIEISCHGSPQICSEILQNLVLSGALPATRGEFTYRAFLNQRLDLAQAEGVLDIIESQSRNQRKLALRQLSGHYSQKLRNIESEIIRILAHIEADIDFSTENLETLPRAEAIQKIKEIESYIRSFALSYEKGKKIYDGIQLALIGAPNVGKSTLFNILLAEDKAIVTDIAGTTRDVLEGEVFFAENKFVISDTAGIRNSTSDMIEKIGIQRSRQKGEEVDLIVLVFDVSLVPSEEEKALVMSLDHQNCLILLNKRDLGTGGEQEQLARWQESAKKAGIFFKDGTGIFELPKDVFLVISSSESQLQEKVLSRVLQSLSLLESSRDDLVVTHARHYECLLASSDRLLRAQKILIEGESLEFVAFELRDSLLKIQEILGIHYDDQILDRVFKEFCLGK